MSKSRQSPEMKSLLVSVLSLGRVQDVLALMTNLPRWLGEFAQDAGIPVHLVVRNNDPNVGFEEVRLRLAQCEREHPVLRCTLVSGQPNSGFGGGHNANYRLCPADYMLMLNDDMGFPHMNWLAEAVALLAREPRTACVGAVETPQYLNPMFGNGQERPGLAVETLKYAEASVLLFSGKVFEELGMFDERLQWAMCEDADLSLRAQQLGYRLRWISIPHEHWRSSTVNSLPAAVRGSILEHNRAKLFASWSQTLASGRIGRLELFDLCSDGMGDVFCVLPHLRAWLVTLPVARRERVVVNTNHPELIKLLDVTGIRITHESSRSGALAALDAEGVTALHSIRSINYSLPMNMHSLLCGALGLPMCDDAGLAAFREVLRNDVDTTVQTNLPASYCVVHIEFARDHQGRGLAPASVRSLLERCSRLFATVVLVGKERRLTAEKGSGTACVFDLRGTLPLRELVAVIAGASHFVGIDSFPAHVAQAAGVRSAIFFGAVHPLARVWDEALVWPLVAGLECIGCYHTHLESSAPFCMRRDEACTIGPDGEGVEQVLRAMLQGEPYAWSRQRRRFEALQGKWFGFMRHHPSPPERLMRPAANGNELVTNLVYRILDQAGELAGSRYRTTAISDLTERLRELETELFDREVELDELRRSGSGLQAVVPTALLADRQPIRIMQLTSLTLRPHNCTVGVTGQWLDVTAFGNDPRLRLPAFSGLGERIQLRLTAVADHADTLQVYWSFGSDDFAEERQHSIALGFEPNSLDLTLDLPAGELLHIRIDPLFGRGEGRLRGSISGAFELQEGRTAERVDTLVEPTVLAAADSNREVPPKVVTSITKAAAPSRRRRGWEQV